MSSLIETPELPAVFDGVKLAAVAAVLYIIVRCLNLKSPTAPPELIYQDTPLARFLIKSCPLLTKEYIPPLIWGKSGHIQTALYGKMGRVSSPHPYGLRKYLTMSDGATATFDLFEPLAENSSKEDITMVICPGIANHSEKQYIRTFVDYAQKKGYRCAVLNHLGALPNIELTSPRMFTAQETFMQWDQCRRFYNFLMADNLKKIILSHRQALFAETTRKVHSLVETDLSRLHMATSLMQIDDSIMRKFHGYGSLREYYEQESCLHYLHRIFVPLLLVNAADDPLVHDSLLSIPRALSEKQENVMFVLPLHGGHLGFFEGSVLFPEPLTWMDKLVVQYADAICQWEKNKFHCSDTEQSSGQE
ncbi:hypothetical protein Chor_001398 [Crotalus horridus]